MKLSTPTTIPTIPIRNTTNQAEEDLRSCSDTMMAMIPSIKTYAPKRYTRKRSVNSTEMMAIIPKSSATTPRKMRSHQ